MKNLLIAFSLILLVSGCKNTQKPTESTLNAIEYKYMGASLPPQYHRSYTIKVDSNKATLDIKDYSKSVKTEQKNLNAAEWQKLVALVDKVQSQTHVAQGATGTSSVVISIMQSDNSHKTVNFDSLSKPSKEATELQLAILALFPNLEQLIQSTITN